MTDADGIDALDLKIEAMEETLGGAGQIVDAFNGELKAMRSTLMSTGREVAILSRGIDRGLKRALEGLAFDGESLSQVLRGLAGSMARAAYDAAVSPVTKQVGGILAGGIEGFIQGALPFARGGSFSQGRVVPFANSGIVRGPTTFGIRGGLGLMGEAGPEAILPLARGADGRLGVKSDGGNARPVNVVINISTPDVEGFRRSQSQIATQVSRVLGRAGRNR